MWPRELDVKWVMLAEVSGNGEIWGESRAQPPFLLTGGCCWSLGKELQLHWVSTELQTRGARPVSHAWKGNFSAGFFERVTLGWLQRDQGWRGQGSEGRSCAQNSAAWGSYSRLTTAFLNSKQAVWCVRWSAHILHLHNWIP